MNKIRIQLQGGLGNQLFILAMAHQLERKHSVHVEIVYVKDNLSRLDRNPEIGAFLSNCDHQISLIESGSLGYIFRFVDKLGSKSTALAKLVGDLFQIYTCKTFFEIPVFMEHTPKILRGYFQNIAVAEENIDDLLMEMGKTIENISDLDIREFDCVLHIRRGDTKEISSSWGVLSIPYYQKRIRSGEKILICTDEKENLESFKNSFPNCTIITANDSSPLQTLAILANSRKLIMANSTLSWWAGWYKSKKIPGSVMFPVPWRPTEKGIEDNLLFYNAKTCNAEFEQNL